MIDPFAHDDTFQSGPAYDPYVYLAAARRRGTVRREWPLPDDIGLGGDDSFSVLGYDEVNAVLRDDETFSSSLLANRIGPLLAGTIVAMDEPEHRVHRALVAPAFRPRLLERWERVLVRRAVDQLIDGVVEDGHADLVRRFTFAVPVLVIARILGLPDADAPRFQQWSLEVVNFPFDPERGMAALQMLVEYFAEQVELRRREPSDDLIGELVGAEIDGKRLSDDEIFAFLRLLLPAGIETTYRSMGNLLFALLTHPEQLAAVAGDPSLRAAAIEEGLRWQPPFIMLPRTAVRDTDISGVDVPAGSLLNVFVGSANRDERRFPDGDRFDVRRAAPAHVSFGAGIHACLGMHLARLETRVALDALLDRLHDLRLDPDAAAPRMLGTMFRSPDALPVCFSAGGDATGR
jgi:cytochrome P450